MNRLTLRHLRLIPTLGLVAAIFVAGCSGKVEQPASDGSAQGQGNDGAAPAQPVRGGTVTIGYPSDIDGVNELIHGSAQQTRHVIEQMFVKLLAEQADYQSHPPTFEPRLAESYEYSEDRTVITFHLRRDAVWSDGEPITADDVRWTWQAQINPAVAWDNVVMKASITDVEVVDPYTVRYHFTHAYPGQLVHINEGAVLPRHAWGKLPFSEWRSSGTWFVDHLVVSGPFKLASWKPQQEIVLERNERYYEPGIPYLDRVVFRIIPDPITQYNEFRSGSIDYLRQVPAGNAAQIASDPRLRLMAYWPPAYCAVVWNLRRPQFSDPAVRRALTMSIDRQAIVDTLWYGYAKPVESPVISSVWGYDDTIKPWPYDPAAARQILDEQGWKVKEGGVRERDGVKFAFDLIVNSGNHERKNAMEMIQQQLKQVGVQARPRTLDWNTVGAKLESRDFDATIIVLGIETSLDFSASFHSRAAANELNYSGYSNPEVDALLDDARRQKRLEDTVPFLHRFQEILHQDQPLTMLWESQRLVGLSRRIQGAKPNPISAFEDLRYWWLLPER